MVKNSYGKWKWRMYFSALFIETYHFMKCCLPAHRYVLHWLETRVLSLKIQSQLLIDGLTISIHV